jgi:hypothetical protein
MGFKAFSIMAFSWLAWKKLLIDDERERSLKQFFTSSRGL